MISEKEEKVIMVMGNSRDHHFSEGANAVIEVEGKLGYRNPLGFMAAYPKSLLNPDSAELGHERILGVFVTQQGTDVPKLSRIDGKS